MTDRTKPATPEARTAWSRYTQGVKNTYIRLFFPSKDLTYLNTLLNHYFTHGTLSPKRAGQQAAFLSFFLFFFSPLTHYLPFISSSFTRPLLPHAAADAQKGGGTFFGCMCRLVGQGNAIAGDSFEPHRQPSA